MRAESYGWERKNKRAIEPGRPLYVHKATNGGGIYVGETHVPRGHLLPAELAAELGAERVKLMFWVRELDHAPLEGITPLEQMPGAAPRTEHAKHKHHRRG